MRLTEISDNIYLAESKKELSSESAIATSAQWQKESGILTYGGMSTDCLSDMFEKKGFSLSSEEICIEDDISLGLDMPNVWYLNKGEFSLNIPLYYNFLQNKVKVKDVSIGVKSRDIIDAYGAIAMVEVFKQDSFEDFLEENEMNYFGTTHTLTECMRVLEGWDTKKITRLEDYVDFAHFIESWSQENNPKHNQDEWYLGKHESRAIFDETGTTNVRDAINLFWNEYLLQKNPKIAPEDVEIDIISPRFAREKQPDFVLLGEDFLDLSKDSESDTHLRFSYFNGEKKSVPLLERRNDKQYATALLAREKYPDAKIILFQYDDPATRFTMINERERKFENNDMTYHLTSALKRLYK